MRTWTKSQSHITFAEFSRGNRFAGARRRAPAAGHGLWACERRPRAWSTGRPGRPRRRPRARPSRAGAYGHLLRSRLVVRRRWPGALRPRGHRDGPGGRGRGLGWRQRAAAAGRRGGGGRDGRLATEQRPRGSRGGSGRAPSSPTATAEQEPLVPLVQRGEEPDLPLRHPARAPGPLPRPRARGRRCGGGREQEVVLMELIPCHERGLRRGRRRRREHPDEPLARRRPSRPVLVHGQSQRSRSARRGVGGKEARWKRRRGKALWGFGFYGGEARRDETHHRRGERRRLDERREADGVGPTAFGSQPRFLPRKASGTYGGGRGGCVRDETRGER